MSSKIIKKCGCGRCYTKSQWKALEYVGVQESETKKLIHSIELRNCICGSTICVASRRRKDS